eukprot:3187715-Prymnesium_polylepis.1
MQLGRRERRPVGVGPDRRGRGGRRGRSSCVRHTNLSETHRLVGLNRCLQGFSASLLSLLSAPSASLPLLLSDRRTILTVRSILVSFPASPSVSGVAAGCRARASRRQRLLSAGTLRGVGR